MIYISTDFNSVISTQLKKKWKILILFNIIWLMHNIKKTYLF